MTASVATNVTASVARAEASVLSQELTTINVLVQRDLLRFVREKSRVVGALVQPLILWLMLGSGMASSFHMPGAEQVGYLEYFYPGVIVMVVLFTAIFATMSVIEDRHSGFLQSVLVAPGSRTSLVLGKSLGSASVALAHGALFLLILPLTGFPLAEVQWLPLLLSLSLICFALCALGFAVAWWLDSTAGYHVVMSLVLLPLWILSGAMFPARGGVLGMIAAANPMSYAVSAVRRGLYGVHLPPALVPAGRSALTEMGVLCAFALASVSLAALVCRRRR